MALIENKTGMRAAMQIGGACTRALLTEVLTTPKPGLVDRINSGAHTDMNLETFLNSLTAIAPYFVRFAAEGAKGGLSPGSVARMNAIGRDCEKAMYRATGGVNTHKGSIYSLGIIASAAGYCYGASMGLGAEAVCEASARIAKSLAEQFSNLSEDTPGRRAYLEYGITGARGEAASGFASVRRLALCLLRSCPEGYMRNDIRLQALLHLMMCVVDTNVISRGGMEALEFVHEKACDCLLAGGVLTREGRRRLCQMDQDFIKKNISPGGCADLLAVALALDHIEQIKL